MASFNLFGSALFALLCTTAVRCATVKQHLAISWEQGSPNGNSRDMIFTNGQFPAPTLIFQEGDYVEITVENQMPFNTTVHWHGLLMQDAPWSDGVPGLSQKPIEPGKDYIYRFKAYPAGTYWYHAHSRMLLLDGLYGALWIKPKPGSSAPWSLISNNAKDINAISRVAANPQFIVASDWTNFTSWDFLAAEEASGLDIFCSDSILVNGKGSVYCPSQEFLDNETNPNLASIFAPRTVSDKGCYPFVNNTEYPYLPGKPDLIPPHLWSGCVPSTGPTEIIKVDQANGWVSLNLVMAATFRAIIFAIDEHDMWLYEIDGQYVQPQLVQTLYIYPGERYAVMVKLDKQPRNYTVRVGDAGITQVISAYAILEYKNAARMPPTTGIVSYGGNITDPGAAAAVAVDNGFSINNLPPFPPILPKRESDAMFVLTLARWKTAWQWTMSGNAILPMDADANDPVLYHPESGLAIDPTLSIRTMNGTWVDLVLRTGLNLPPGLTEIEHVLHKHSSRVWIIGNGFGVWNYTSVAKAIAAEPRSFNLVNPPYKDTFTTPFSGAAWVVIRYQVTNPGPWLLHCHVETHLAGGMAMVIMDGVDVWPEIPPEYSIDQAGHYL